MCQQFPKFFFSSEVWQIFVCINRGVLTKYSFLFFVVKILLKFSKEKTLAGTAINGTNTCETNDDVLERYYLKVPKFQKEHNLPLFSNKPQGYAMCKFRRFHRPTFIFNLGLVLSLVFLPLFGVEGIETIYHTPMNTFFFFFWGPHHLKEFEV